MSHTDLVNRLRCYADLNDAVFHPWVYGEAADRIEKLEAALRMVIDALKDENMALATEINRLYKKLAERDV